MKSSSPNQAALVGTFVVILTAFVGLGMSMPSCPGQQAMQQQIDSIQASNTDLSKRLQTIDSQTKTLNGDMSQVKQLLKPMSDAIQAQKTAIDQLDANFKELQTKLAAAAAAKPAAKSAPKTSKGAPAAKKHH